MRANIPFCWTLVIAGLAIGTVSCGQRQMITPTTPSSKTADAEPEVVPCRVNSCPEVQMQLAVIGSTEGQTLIAKDMENIDWKMNVALAVPKSRQIKAHAYNFPPGISVRNQGTDSLEFTGIATGSMSDGTMIVLVRDVSRCRALQNGATSCDVMPASAPSNVQSWEQKLSFTYSRKAGQKAIAYEQQRLAELQRQATQQAQQEALQAACLTQMGTGALTAIFTGNLLGGIVGGFMDCAKSGAFNQ